MEAVRQYVITICAAAIICGILMTFAPKGASQGFLKILCGLFLAFSALQPILKMDIGSILDSVSACYTFEADTVAALGEDISRDAISQRIKAETEAYILDKAAALGVTLEAEVTIDTSDTLLPVSVTLRGDASPHARRQLEQIITVDLGISKENQLWTQ